MTGPTPRDSVQALPAYVAGRRATSPNTAALASNESHHEPLPSVVQAVQAAVQRMNRYPDMANTELRQAIADHFGISIEEVAAGPGSVAVLDQVIRALCDDGAEVVMAWRSFEAYPILTQLAGATCVQVPLRPDEHHDLAAMAAAITTHTKVVLLCTPNNPTGVAIDRTALTQFLDKVPARVAVVLDEAYIEYMDGDARPDTRMLYLKHPNLIVLRTFSKAYGLAGLRVGYGLARPELADGLRRAVIPFGVSSVAQLAGIASLQANDEMKQRVQVIKDERPRVLRAARELGWPLPDSQANFIWIRCNPPQLQTYKEAFDDADIMVRAYPSDGIRITLSDPATNDRVLAVLAALVRK